MSAQEPHSLRGSIDPDALYDVQIEFERLEPLASGEYDDFINPDKLLLRLSDGIGDAERATISVLWSVSNEYNIHYTDSADRNFRWDVHPNDYTAPSGDAHFHPPPDASNDDDDVEPSCIRVTEIILVTRAIHRLWRTAYDAGSFDPVSNARLKRPLEYIGTFHGGRLGPFYSDCLSWLTQR